MNCFWIVALAVGCWATHGISAETTPKSGLVASEVPATAAPQFSLADVKPLEAILDHALTAYNSSNASQFLALFGKAANPPAEPRLFTALYVGVYQTDFGKCVSKQLNAKETLPDADRGVLVYDALFEKRKVKLSANFLREQGVLKLVQIRLERR